jgi:hypothetical protein
MSSPKNLYSYIISFIISEVDMYFVIVVDSAIVCCFLLDQLIVMLPRRKEKPIVDH